MQQENNERQKKLRQISTQFKGSNSNQTMQAVTNKRNQLGSPKLHLAQMQTLGNEKPTGMLSREITIQDNLCDSQVFQDVKIQNNPNMELSVSSSYPTISNKYFLHKQKKLMQGINEAKNSRSSFMTNGSVIEQMKFD